MGKFAVFTPFAQGKLLDAYRPGKLSAIPAWIGIQNEKLVHFIEEIRSLDKVRIQESKTARILVPSDVNDI